jgi:hypothetical protein
VTAAGIEGGVGAATTDEAAAGAALALELGLGTAALVARGAALNFAELESAGEHALPSAKQATSQGARTRR